MKDKILQIHMHLYTYLGLLNVAYKQKYPATLVHLVHLHSCHFPVKMLYTYCIK